MAIYHSLFPILTPTVYVGNKLGQDIITNLCLSSPKDINGYMSHSFERRLWGTLLYVIIHGDRGEGGNVKPVLYNTIQSQTLPLLNAGAPSLRDFVTSVSAEER